MCLLCFIIGLLLLIGGFRICRKKGFLDEYDIVLIVIAAGILITMIFVSWFYITTAVKCWEYANSYIDCYWEDEVERSLNRG